MKENDWPLYVSKMAEITAIKPVAPLVHKVPLLIFQGDCNRSCQSVYFDGSSHSHYKSHFYHSGPFYSHPNGYKMQFKVEFVCHCLDCKAKSFGLWKGNFPIIELDFTASLLVDFYLLQGEYDAELKWPFKYNATITLLNDQRNDNHQKVTKSYIGNKNPNAKGERLYAKQASQSKGDRLSQVAKQLKNHHLGRDKFHQLYQEYCKYMKPDTLCFAFNSRKCMTKLFIVLVTM